MIVRVLNELAENFDQRCLRRHLKNFDLFKKM